LLQKNSLACEAPHLIWVLVDGGYVLSGEERDLVQIEADETNDVAASGRQIRP